MRAIVTSIATIAVLQLVGYYAGQEVAAVVAMLALAFAIGVFWAAGRSA